MRLFTAPRLALAALVPALFVLSVIPGCSNGGEGERCGDPGGTITDNSDCGSGLVCTAFPMYMGSTETVGRCCYPDRVTDSRCSKSSNTSATNTPSGGASASDAGATSSDAGSSDAVAGGGGSGGLVTELAGAGGAAGSK
jgi:hypothetical protein